MALYAFEGQKPQVGEGSFVAESATVIGSVAIGKNVYVGHGVILRGDYGQIIVGDGTALEEGVIVHARPKDKTMFGQRVTVGHGAMIHNATIKDFAVIGMRSTISDFSIVGEWAIIGEMSLVKRNQEIPDGSVAVGSPAKVIGKVTAEQKEFWSYGKELYIEMAERYRTPGAFERIEPEKIKKS
ncbi:MAG: gamma carbonic anhydrase family protein [Candidatus Aminicenantes bacterium]|jgi:carbonic anhydrase/acetyltransferase-like protein (isoleucine patch superfamily)